MVRIFICVVFLIPLPSCVQKIPENRMKKIFSICLLLTVICSQLTTTVYADYVLPYPSYMPGNKMYRVMRVVDQVKRYWYWGNIAQVKYHQSLADKYLIEAKTLFEYKQYLLAADALTRSDSQVEAIVPFIDKARQQGIDTKLLRTGLAEEMSVHLSVLKVMNVLSPKEFVWTPEKAKPTDLHIGTMLEHSFALREETYANATSSAQSDAPNIMLQ